MPDDDNLDHGFLDYLGFNVAEFTDYLDSIKPVKLIDLYPVVDGQYVVTVIDSHSFVAHIAVALRTLVDDGAIKPGVDTDIFIYQDGEGRGACIEYLRASPNACKVRLIT
jgi:hypothetical protein